MIKMEHRPKCVELVKFKIPDRDHLVSLVRKATQYIQTTLTMTSYSKETESDHKCG